MGEQVYRVDGKLPLPVTEKEDDVLQAFIGLQAMKEKTLIDRTGDGDPNAARTFRNLRKKYNGYFADALRASRVNRRRRVSGHRINGQIQ